jgi:FKBP-type peptidyl-prolyl cis-trans isomerase FklB
MKLKTLLTVAVGFCCMQAMAAQQTTAAPAVAAPVVTVTTPVSAPLPTVTGFTSDKEKISYAIGVDLGANFKAQNIDVNPATLQRGLNDVLSGGKLAMTKEQVAATLIAFQKNMMAKQKALFDAASAKNVQDGAAFLAANKTKPGVKTTASGLQYKVITAGKGVAPKDNDTVTVDYQGTFINGQVFDSSYQRGKPVTFPVSEVIPGWTEMLKLMQPGETVEAYVPANLAYGERGMGNVIGPNQTLIFKIHLISVKQAG